MDEKAPVSSGRSLARRSIISLAWNAIARLVKLPVGFLLTIVLARLLPVEAFGIVAGMEAAVLLMAAFFEFGAAGAYFHRCAETEDEERATTALFTLRVLMAALWIVVVLILGGLFLSGIHQQVFFLWGVTAALLRVAGVPVTLLMRRVQHRLMAYFDLTLTLVVFIVASLAAVYTRSVWALLMYPLCSLVWTVVVFYIWKPVWKPRLAWDPAVMRYLWNFGWRSLPAGVLGMALDHVDDLWTNVFLGDLVLGYYSRAYRLAIYPRQVLAEPINTVISAAYAELKHDRRRLSLTFERVLSLLIRSGFLLGGWMAVIAPHFIVIFMGAKWLPLLNAFRLMLVYTLFDPLKSTIASVLIAVGKPEKVSLVRFIQLLVMLVGLFTLGNFYGIEGVALAVDGMLLVGIVLIFMFVHPYVDFSLLRLFAAPALALGVGLALAWFVGGYWKAAFSDWLAGALKTLLFGLGYFVVLFAFERSLIFSQAREIYHLVGDKISWNQPR